MNKLMSETKKLCISSMLVALSIILSYLIHFIGGMELGKMLLPMHFIVFLIGFICGMKYAVISGIIIPFINLIINGNPQMPNTILMSIELLSYGLIISLLKNKINIYITLFTSMIFGRFVNLILNIILYKINNSNFILSLFIVNNILSGIVGILVEIIFIPIIIYALKKKGLVDVKW